MNLVGSVSEGFGFFEYIYWEEDSFFRVVVCDEVDFNFVWSWFKFGEDYLSCNLKI